MKKHVLLHPASDTEPAGGYFHPNTKMSSITASDISAYTKWRIDQGAAAATVNRELAAIRRAYRLAVRNRELIVAPCVELLSEHNTRTGWRRAEILNLTWAQVDRAAQVIRLEVGTTKSGKGRTLPYGDRPEVSLALLGVC